MDAIIFTLAIVGGLVIVRAVASFFELRARMRDQMRSAPRGDQPRAGRGGPSNSDTVSRLEDVRVPNDDRRFSIPKSQLQLSPPLELRGDHCGTIARVPRARVEFEDDSQLEILERVARACAEQARTDAENVRGTTVERIHLETQARYLRFAKMVKAVRLRPDREPPANVRQLRPDRRPFRRPWASPSD